MSEMSIDRSPELGQYEIRLAGRLHPRWAAWFDGMSLTPESDGTTVLSGSVIDQAALHGLLQKVRDAGLPLISVARLDPRSPMCPPPGVADPSTHTGRST
jgi:hypothetical protein